MGMVGKEIIQSRVWIDPQAPKPPELNYKNTYPITVYDAVKENMDDDSPNLGDLLQSITQELKTKQPIFAGKPSNFLMTFAGTPGAVGSIVIGREIPWDPSLQRDDRIPTEKAVGDLLFKLGLVDSDGNIDPNGGTKVDWQNVIGRPILYTELGDNDDGFITQKGITVLMNSMTDQLGSFTTDTGVNFKNVNDKIDAHIIDTNNPHNVTIDQIGALSKETFESHIEDLNNPHNVTKLQLGLDNVDNTSDVNKPISNATKDALDIINKLIVDMSTDLGNFIMNGSYDQLSGDFTLIFRDGSTMVMHIPINGLVDEIAYKQDTKELVIIELGGKISKIDISELFVRYLGSVSTQITLTIDNVQSSGNHTISASINPRSLTDGELADASVITRIIKDQNVTTDKIKDLSITTIKLKDKSVTTDKIDELSVTTAKIADRSIIGKKLFSAMVDNRILGVLSAGADPVWLQANSDMIADNSVHTNHIMNKSVISDKLDDKSVITSKLDDLGVTTDKIANLAVTDDKINNSTISGGKLITDILFNGTPKIMKRPDDIANNNQIPDTFWVNNKLDKAKFRNDNLLDRSIDGRTLFTSSAANKALVVLGVNSDPVWGLINNGMMDINSIGTNNIIDMSVIDTKLADSAIKSRHITNLSVLSDHIQESAIDSTKIWKSDTANRVLATLTNGSHPVYTQITRDMIMDNAVGTRQIEDRTVTLSKLISSPKNNRLLGVVLKNTDPVWIQASNEMLGDRSVDGRVLFTPVVDNRVLAVADMAQDPGWIQINGKMMVDRTIQRNNIAAGAIYGEHIQDKAIESQHITNRGINSINIAARAITGSELFTSTSPNKILAVTTSYSNPDWMQVGTDMIADKAITREKMFQSKYAYTLLGVTQEDVPPEYLKITSDFIVDDSIIPQKLVKNFVLYGVPEMTERPDLDAENRQIPDTYWVRKIVANMIKDFNPKILFDLITTEMIQEKSITADKLFTYEHAPRVLGITEPGGIPEYILIEEDLIVDGSITKYKIQKDITLLGSPTVEVRPFANASDALGGGQLIPDCQWVLDRIGSSGGTSGLSKFDPQYFVETSNGISLNLVNVLASRSEIDSLFDGSTGGGSGGTGGGGTGGGTTGEVGFESITTDNLANRAVTGDKMFSSVTSNRLLGVLVNNTSPQYIQAVNDMISDRSIDGRTLFTSPSANKVLGVTTPGSNPAWLLINNGMMDKDSVGTIQLINNSVTNNKIDDNSVDGRTLFSSAIANRILGVVNADSDPAWIQVNYDMMAANSIGTTQLRNAIVITSKIADYAITQIKLDRSPIIDTVRLVDKSVVSSKIDDQAVVNSKIADHTIQPEKLAQDIELQGFPTVKSNTSYETRSLRNTILSPDAPTGGQDGDIWLRYI